MAKDLAREIGYIYIDSGAMYRAVTLYSLQKGFFSEKGIDTEALKTAMPDIHISFRLNPETQRPMTFHKRPLALYSSIHHNGAVHVWQPRRLQIFSVRLW